MRIEPFLEALAAEAIHETLDVEAPPILRPTQDPKHGDYQVNGVLGLAKKLKKNPRELAGPVAERLAAHDAVASAEVAGPGFVNLRLEDGWIGRTLGDVRRDRDRDGVPTVGAKETVVVDFSSPNIAKQMHVGHLRSTIIGDALVRMLRFTGHEVIGDNHLGDWGTQFGLLIVGMREWGDEAALERTPIVELERVYKLASAKAKEDDAFAERARAELAKLQRGDEANRALWERFVETTKKSLNAIYDRLGVEFDEWLGESAYDEMLPDVVQRLLDAGIAREDQGAICVWFDELEGVEGKLAKQEVPFIVRKGDGAYLYSTTDIATALHRKERFGADRSLYVVGFPQKQHFEQLFEVVRQLGVEMGLEHITFGSVLGPDGKVIRTRSGEAITLTSLLDEAEERAEAKMREELQLDAEMARALRSAIGIGAVKYADLMQNRTSDYKFDWDKLISFHGNAGPYLQYQHARCCSILRKGAVDPGTLEGAVRVEEDAEKTLARRLLAFADVVHRATEQRYPHYLTDHLYALARDFSSFFDQCPVLKAEGGLRDSRLSLVDLTRRQLARGLGLLGIEAPERM
ncbi:MAG TPA: arginine--tRNA ligase [Sandaracinaceae bacterium LLY-WYZ-13_1]|nr:arginine--tRNA ligase [Sandaracinaceae bacterium LLY-WYZ-13_1]